MSKHTPGPWIAVGGWVEHPDDKVADICVCDPAEFNQEHFKRSEAEQSANARLIAAAPELLEALRNAAHQLETDALYMQINGANGNQQNQAAAQARAAIKKATGEDE